MSNTIAANGITYTNVSDVDLAVMRRVFGSELTVGTPKHAVEVITDTTRRYPHFALCSCGYESRGYVHKHAARLMADDHVA